MDEEWNGGVVLSVEGNVEAVPARFGEEEPFDVQDVWNPHLPPRESGSGAHLEISVHPHQLVPVRILQHDLPS